MMKMILLSTLVVSALAGVSLKRQRIPQRHGRIVGGQPTTIIKHPYVLSLQYRGTHDCGASIIGQNAALTAAHCTDGRTASSLSVRAGTSFRDYGGQVVNVSRISQHPEYTSNSYDYDISVLHLSHNLNLGARVKIVQLAALNQYVPIQSQGVVCGWGNLEEGGFLPNQLQAVTVPIISIASCKYANRDIETVTSRMICAGYKSGGKDACQGDSGGPLVVGGVQIGIVSWGHGCAQPNFPGVYASVPNLRNFIKDVCGV